MFSPNTKPGFHHRSVTFHNLMYKLEKAFKQLAGLNEDWDVLFLTGSGALGLEAVFHSAVRPITPLFVESMEAEFSRRLVALSFDYGKHGILTEDVAYVQYETATSVLNSSGWEAKGITIVDCVSAFPFYLPPEDADIFVTVSGKQLEAPPGIAIVAIHKRVWANRFFIEEDETQSYLNLARHLQYKRKGETPNTPAITVLYDLWQVLIKFDREGLIQRVKNRYSALEALVGADRTMSPPVYTFKDKLPGQGVLGLYGKKRTQLFLWDSSTDSDKKFEDLLNEIRRLQDEGLNSAFWRT